MRGSAIFKGTKSTNNMDSTTINDLSDEILTEILGYLNLSELVEKKLTSKLWNKLISSSLKISRLVVDPNMYYKCRWFSSRRWINKHLEMCHPNLFVTQLDRSILSDLKCLRAL